MTNPTTVLVSNTGYVADIAAVKASTGTAFTIVGSQKQTVTDADIAAEPFIFIVSKDAAGLLKYSPAIYRDNLKHIEASPYIGVTQQSAAIKFPAPDAATGNYIGKEFVVRIVYKDIYGHPGQFTQTYRVNGDSIVPAGATVSANDLAAAMAAAINRPDEYSIRQEAIARVAAAVTADTVTLTAMERNDVTGVYSINEYAQVNFEVTSWVSIENDKLNNVYTPIGVFGGVVSNNVTTPKPGKGNYMLVRDREKLGVAYKGGLNAKAWPAQFNSTNWHTFTTDAASTYNSLTIISQADYMSDNRFPRHTQYVTELYIKTGATGIDTATTVLNAFIAASNSTNIVANTASDGTVNYGNAIAVLA